MQYCSLQHRTLLLSPVTSTAGYSFRFGSIPSFFLVLFLHSPPVAYWAPPNLGNSSFLGIWPGVALLDHMLTLFLVFQGIYHEQYETAKR